MLFIFSCLLQVAKLIKIACLDFATYIVGFRSLVTKKKVNYDMRCLKVGEPQEGQQNRHSCKCAVDRITWARVTVVTSATLVYSAE